MNYCLYGISASSNIQIHYVDSCKAEADFSLNVDYNYEEQTISSIRVNQDDEDVYIDLNPFAQYWIDLKKCEIKCSARNYESFFSTFFNIPFSSYLILRGEVLLHASSMILGDALICFAGEKGVGKSTLTNLLHGDVLKQYSDDTLRVDSQYKGYKGNNLSKLKEDSIEKLCTKRLAGYRNAVGKQYIELDTDFKPRVVGAFIRISRTNESIKLKKVTSKIAQRAIIFDNIVGLNYFSPVMLKKALKKVETINIPVFTLEVPDDLDQLVMERDKILNMIKELF